MNSKRNAIEPIAVREAVIYNQTVVIKTYPCQYQDIPRRPAFPRNEAASQAAVEAFSFFLNQLA